MLNQITLTNFKRHESLSVEFGSGINAVKAENEAGKSSLLQAIAYALFGSRALPDSLDDVVTFGKPVNSMKVELYFTLQGVKYKLSRSKASAELSYGDETVTGQGETAKFVADLLGADAALASKLLIANQGDIQGALTGGARGASELIERLADFKQLDDLLELMQAHLTTGSPAGLKARLERAENVLAEAPDVISEQELAELEHAEQVTKACADESHKLVHDASDGKRSCDASLHAAMQAEAKHSADVAREQALRKALDDVEASEPEASAGEPVSLDTLRRAVAEAQASLALRAAFDEVQARNAALDAKWGREVGESSRYEGTEAAAKAELTAARQGIDARRAEISKLRESCARNEALILTGSCTACGKDLSDVAEVQQRNAALRQEVQAWAERIDALLAENEDWQQFVESITNAISENSRTLQSLPKSANASLGVAWVPGNLVWNGPAPLPADELSAALATAQEALNNAVADNATLDLKRRTYEDWRRRVESARHAYEAALAASQQTPASYNVTDLKSKAEAARAEHESALRAHAEATAHYEQKRDALREAKHNQQLAKQAREHAEKELATCRADLKQLEFNNELVKAVREARPLVTNRLWNLVLSAVGSYFSDMRGVPSEVTRASDGFKVDGHPVSTLSGSTKDALGLAIRVALMRTFLPALSLLILDEPNAAMDAERTAQVLGFVASSGFDQVLIVSHDEMTVDVADHIITLENG